MLRTLENGLKLIGSQNRMAAKLLPHTTAEQVDDPLYSIARAGIQMRIGASSGDFIPTAVYGAKSNTESRSTAPSEQRRRRCLTREVQSGYEKPRPVQ